MPSPAWCTARATATRRPIAQCQGQRVLIEASEGLQQTAALQGGPAGRVEQLQAEDVSNGVPEGEVEPDGEYRRDSGEEHAQHGELDEQRTDRSMPSVSDSEVRHYDGDEDRCRHKADRDGIERCGSSDCCQAAAREEDQR
ncbi:hypothetical protein GCM10025783_29860 [Amnibacterium soli]|uniref:Uncharacterized protein n=1 Tax=Amnibacterium soli TaxID=1282736 RepID=A0ABP8ZF20_9MICO